eukprot:696347-Hanusia_phi.AAC.1
MMSRSLKFAGTCRRPGAPGPQWPVTDRAGRVAGPGGRRPDTAGPIGPDRAARAQLGRLRDGDGDFRVSPTR